MSKYFQVVCVGVVTLDALALVDRYPRADERVLGEELMIAGGGPAANAAVVLARQGISVAFIGRVGNDSAGKQALALLEEEGVDVSGVLVDPASRTQASCVVVSKESQSRAISTLAVKPLPEFEAFGARAKVLIENAKWVHTDHLGFLTAANYLKKMSQANRPRLAVDAGNPVAGLDLSLLDLYVPTTESMTLFLGESHTPEGIEKSAHASLKEGALAVVATQGSKGSMAWWGNEFAVGEKAGYVSAPATKGVNIQSTLGAGDVFHGALLSAICRGCDWRESLVQANATAALSCRALDGRSAVPTLSELESFLATNR